MFKESFQEKQLLVSILEEKVRLTFGNDVVELPRATAMRLTMFLYNSLLQHLPKED